MKFNLMSTISLVATSVLSAIGIADAASSNTFVAVGQAGKTLSSDSPIIVESNNGMNWALPTITGLPESSGLKAVSCVNDICVAVGEDFTGYRPPMIVERRDGDWSKISELVTFGGSYSDISCAANNETVICAVPGLLVNGSTFVAQSINGKWELASIPVIETLDIDWPTSSCASTESDMLCVVGTNGILQSLNGGDWTYSYKPEDFTINFQASACISLNSKDIYCVAAGGSSSPIDPAGYIIVESINGVNWTVTNVAGLASPQFAGISCITDSSCVAVGVSNNNENPILVQKLNGNWISQPIPYMSDTSLESVSCVKDGSPYGYCMVVGTSFTGEAPIPVVGEWSNGAWTYPKLNLNASLDTASCIAAKPVKCIVGGFEGPTQLYNTSTPLLLETTSNGSLVQVIIPDVPTPGHYLGTSAISSENFAGVFHKSDSPKHLRGAEKLLDIA